MGGLGVVDRIAMWVAGLLCLLLSLGMLGMAYWKGTNGHFLSAVASIGVSLFLGMLAVLAFRNSVVSRETIEEEATEL